MPRDNQLERSSPVRVVDTGSPFDDARNPSGGIALCLSGGGYRAMLFHLGALWRLNEFGYLPKLARISSVSGGSLTAGVLGHRWVDAVACVAGLVVGRRVPIMSGSSNLIWNDPVKSPRW